MGASVDPPQAINTDIITEEQHKLDSHATGDFTYVFGFFFLRHRLTILLHADCFAMLFNSHSKVLRTDHQAALKHSTSITTDIHLVLIAIRATLINVSYFRLDFPLALPTPCITC